MTHNFDKYFDTSSEYWQKIQKIYEENDHFPKIVVKNRNLHHKFMRSFSRLEGTEIDNDKDNLVSLSEGDHFLVHYYLWKCTKQGFRRQTGLPVRFMYKKAAKYLTDEIAELISKEWTCKGYHHSKETKEKISKANKGVNNGMYGKHHTDTSKCISKGMLGKHPSEETKKKMAEAAKDREGYWKGKARSEETKRKIAETNKGKCKHNKGKHWKLVDGKRVWY